MPVITKPKPAFIPLSQFMAQTLYQLFNRRADTPAVQREKPDTVKRLKVAGLM